MTNDIREVVYKVFKKRYEQMFAKVFICGYLEGYEMRLTSLFTQLTELKKK